MKITFSPEALQFLQEKGETAVTLSSLVFSSCCSGPLPPEVKPGAPADAEGFTPYQAGGVTLFWDSLLDPRPDVTIELADYVLYQELAVKDWA